MDHYTPSHRDEPVKQRSEPVACKKCGRTNWSRDSLCVYCRLDWPDPDQIRGLRANKESVGTLSLAQPHQPQPTATASAEQLPSLALKTIATDVAGRFVEDLSCNGCGYNLRGMRQADECPECGQHVEASLHMQELVMADPAWLRKLATGGWFVFTGLMMGLISPLFLYGAVSFFIVIFLGAMVLVGMGVALLTSPLRHSELHRTTERTTHIPRLLARITSPAPLILASAAMYAPLVWWPMGIEIAIIAATLGTAICASSTMTLLAHYSRKMDDQSVLEHQAIILAVILPAVLATPILLALSVVLLALGASQTGQLLLGCATPLVAFLTVPMLIWTTVLFAVFASTFERTATLAESHRTANTTNDTSSGLTDPAP